MPPRIHTLKVVIEKPKIPKKDWVKYLILIDWHHTQLGDDILTQPSKEFNDFVMTKLDAYMEGKVKAAQVNPAIVNLAEDVLAGREMSLRTGDYLSLQKDFRAAR